MKKIITVLLTMLILAGCGAGQPAAPKQSNLDLNSGELPINLNVADVEQLRQNNDVVLLDVREDWEYEAGHVPGAVLLPLGNIPNSLSDIPKDKTVIAICRSGNRSNQATQFLRQQGFDNVHNMEGGMTAWEQARYEIE